MREKERGFAVDGEEVLVGKGETERLQRTVWALSLVMGYILEIILFSSGLVWSSLGPIIS